MFSENRQTNAQPQGYPYAGNGMYPYYPPAVQAQGQPPQAPYGFPPQPSGSVIPGMPPGTAAPMPGQIPGMLPLEQSYVENILRLNRGKRGTFYFTFENNSEWNAIVINGAVEEAGRDHIIIRETNTGRSYLMLMVNFDYATFDEPLNYEYPFGATPPRPIPPR